MRGRLHKPSIYETVAELSQNDQIIPIVVLKNHSKSHENCKMKNPIVLDLEWVDLHNEHIIWYVYYIFCCSFRSMLFSLL
jgi:hypothetical protein